MIITSRFAVSQVSSGATYLQAQQTTPMAAMPRASSEVSISTTARALLASEQTPANAEVAQRLAEIKKRPAVERSPADYDYLRAHDQRFVELGERDPKTWTADEVDYMQKAGGFVNTMAKLSPKEKAMYDQLVAEGNHEAAAGLNLVAMARMLPDDQEVTLPDGKVFNPNRTEVTADNIRKLFRQMFVDPSGQTDRSFEALASWLDRQAPASV